jgi:hypothetical protein
MSFLVKKIPTIKKTTTYFQNDCRGIFKLYRQLDFANKNQGIFGETR